MKKRPKNLTVRYDLARLFLHVTLTLGSLYPAQGFSQSGRQPVPQFKDLQQPIDPDANSRCNQTEDYGCGEIITVGSLAKSTFTYEDLFVSCGTNENGMYIRLANSLSAQPTFQLLINIWHTTEPPKLKVCKGIEQFDEITDDPSNVRTGACELIVKVHNEALAAAETRQCLVVFNQDDGETWEGNIHCQMLELYGKYLSIDNRSYFTCPGS